MTSKDREGVAEDLGSSGLEDPIQQSLNSDAQDLQRLGHRQVFKRVLKPIGLFLWSCNSLTYWQFLLFTIDPSLTDGGRAGLIWSSVVITLLSFPIVFSLAEMSSRAPTAGALYHWTSEFAPTSIQRPLSYLVGWFTLLAYISSNAAGLLINASVVQTIVSIYAPSSALAHHRWPVIVFVLIEDVFDVIINVWFFAVLPSLQWFFFGISFGTWLLLIISISIASPKATATEVFTEFNTGGWANVPLAIFVSQSSAMSWAFVGYDGVAHASEETRNAAAAVPTTTVAAWVVNGIMNHGILLALLFAVPNVQDAVNSGFTFLYILDQLPWKGLELTILILLIISLLGGNIDYTMSTSREIFAFARDFGLPASKYFQKIDPKLDLPNRATILTTIASTLLTLIYLGSPVAFYAIVSLAELTLLISYFIAIASMLSYRMRVSEKGSHDLTNMKWQFGQWLGEKWMRNMNIASLVLLPWCIFWAAWPLYIPITVKNFNWAWVMFTAVFVFSGTWYIVRGKRNWVAPADRMALT